jgi:hypothetical protein
MGRRRSGCAELRAAVVALLLAAAAFPAAGTAQDHPRRDPSTLSVWRGGEWHRWWRSDSAPARWVAPDPVVDGALTWQRSAPGVDWATLRVSGAGEAWRLGLIVVRVDPRLNELRLDVVRRSAGRTGPWSVGRAPRNALVSLNAGHFTVASPWGWVVMDGREIIPPGSGPLSSAVLLDSTGRIHVVAADSISHYRARGGVVQAIQSYPTVIHGDGSIPDPLLTPGRGVSHSHRDSRLAIGTLRDGRVLIVLTRFEGLAGRLDLLPFGPTIPEMAAIMGALGASRAVLLDGGISGQLALRDPAGRIRSWKAIRDVPLGLVFVAADRRRGAAGDGADQYFNR